MKMARNPASSSSASHWNDRNGPVMVESHRYRAQSTGSSATGATPRNRSDARTDPVRHAPRSHPSATPAGTMPAWPTRPRICVASDQNAARYERAKQAEKPPAGERVCRRPGIASPHHRRHARRDVAVLRNRSIDHLGHGARDRDGLVEMDRQPRAYRREETKHRFRGLGDAAVRFDELDGTGTAVLWNLRKPLRDISALIRRELDKAA